MWSKSMEKHFVSYILRFLLLWLRSNHSHVCFINIWQNKNASSMLSFPRGKIMLSNTLKLTIFTAQKFAWEEKKEYWFNKTWNKNVDVLFTETLLSLHSEINFRRNLWTKYQSSLEKFCFTFGCTVYSQYTVTHTRAIGVTCFILLGDTSTVQRAVYISFIKRTLV